MDKIVFYLGIVVLGVGFIIGQVAKTHIDPRYDYIPPYSNEEEANVARMLDISGALVPIGGTVTGVGALWLILSAISGGKRTREGSQNGSKSADAGGVGFCGPCRAPRTHQAAFCGSCGTPFQG